MSGELAQGVEVLVAAGTVYVQGGVFEVEGTGLGGVEVEFTGDTDKVFWGVKEVLEKALVSDEVGLTALTEMVVWMLAVMGCEVFFPSEGDVTGRAGEAGCGVDSIEVCF